MIDARRSGLLRQDMRAMLSFQLPTALLVRVVHDANSAQVRYRSKPHGGIDKQVMTDIDYDSCTAKKQKQPLKGIQAQKATLNKFQGGRRFSSVSKTMVLGYGTRNKAEPRNYAEKIQNAMVCDDGKKTRKQHSQSTRLGKTPRGSLTTAMSSEAKSSLRPT